MKRKDERFLKNVKVSDYFKSDATMAQLARKYFLKYSIAFPYIQKFQTRYVNIVNYRYISESAMFISFAFFVLSNIVISTIFNDYECIEKEKEC